MFDINKWNREYYKKNKEKIGIRNKLYAQSHKEKVNVIKRRWKLKNIDYVRKQNREYNKKHRVEINKREGFRRKHDLNTRLKLNLRLRIKRALTFNIKSKRTLQLIGCSIPELKIHLERQFKPGMSWNNYTFFGWHIDHIKPCSSFNLTKYTQQKKCFNYKNLQPLWAIENIRKGDTY